VLSDLPPDQAPTTSAALALFTDAEARAIWARAAQLHTEADEAGKRARGADEPHDAQVRTVALAVTAPAGMFFGRDVVIAATEAGIDAAHVAVALAEHEAADSDIDIAPSDAQRARFVRELGGDTGSLRAVAFLPGTRAAVIEQLRATFGRAPWQLTFDGTVGAAVGASEVLRFRVPTWLDTGEQGTTATLVELAGGAFHDFRIDVPWLSLGATHAMIRIPFTAHVLSERREKTVRSTHQLGCHGRKFATDWGW
jgi:hypothetical protein